MIVKQAIRNRWRVGSTKFFGYRTGCATEALIADIGAEALATSFSRRRPSPSTTRTRPGCTNSYTAAYNGPADKGFVDQTYDATFWLAGDRAGRVRPTAPKWPKPLRAVASAPGEKVGPGEWEKAKALIAEGKDIDYDGAGGSYDFDGNGDVAGFIGKFVVDGDVYKQIAIVE